MSGLSPEASAGLRAVVERRLDGEELEAYPAVPVSRAEREEVLSLVAWFRGRYPTPADRLASVRRTSQRWTQTAGNVQ